MPRSHQRSDVGEGGDGGCMVVLGELGDQCRGIEGHGFGA
jgi:hypothetical protein